MAHSYIYVGVAGYFGRPDDAGAVGVFRRRADAANSRDGGVYRSEDAGETWRRYDKVRVNGTIMSVGLHHADPDQVYNGARYDGEVFGTMDGGETWQAFPLPGPVKDIQAVACG